MRGNYLSKVESDLQLTRVWRISSYLMLLERVFLLFCMGELTPWILKVFKTYYSDHGQLLPSRINVILKVDDGS